MIKIEGRSLKIPTQERIIGWVGDNRVEVRIFELIRHYGDIDLAGFDFKLDTQSGDVKNIIDLDKTVADDKITLTWTVKESHILNPGHMSIQIRAFSAGEEKWHSAQGYVKVQPSINASAAIPDPLPSEFVQMEQRVTAAKNEAIEAAQEAKQQAERVEDIIQEAEQDVLPELRQAIEDGIETKNQLGGSIQEAGEAKTALDGSISSAGTAKGELDGSITEANTAKGQLDDSIDLAGNAKTELDGSITTAEQTKQALDESIATGDLDSFKADYMQFKNDSTLKSAKIEKELNDYKATMQQVNIHQSPTQKASGHGIVSLPPNAAEGQVSGVVRGLTATNLIKNGNFAKGAIGWSIVSGSSSYKIVYEDKTLSFTKIGEGTLLSIIQAGNIIGGHKYYISGYIKSTIPFSTPNDWFLYMPETLGQGRLGAVTEQYTRKSYIRERKTDASSYILALVSAIVPPMGATVSIKDVMVIDLTATFGAGNEPTKEECDKIFANWFDGTKSTISASRLKSVGKNLFDESKLESVNSYRSLVWDGKVLSLYDYANALRYDHPFVKYVRSLLKVGHTYTSTHTVERLSGDSGAFGAIWFYNDTYGSFEVFAQGDGDRKKTFTVPEDFFEKWGTSPLIIYGTLNGTGERVRISRLQIEESSTATPYEPYKESIAYINGAGELRSLPNGIKDKINVVEGKYTKRVSDPVSISNTMYASIDKTTYVNVDVVKTTAFSLAQAGTTGKDGMTRLYDKNGVELTEVAQTDIDNTASIDKYYWHTDKTLWIIVAKGAYADITAARTALGTMTLNYQLAEPVEIPVQVSGTLVGYPSGTVYLEPFVPDAGIYDGGISILHHDLPIKSIERISKIDYTTGLEYDLDVSKATIAQDKLSFTHPDIEDGDIIFFVYEYDRESTTGEMAVEYYDSRFVVEDSAVPGKFYKIKFVVTNGVASIVLEEV